MTKIDEKHPEKIIFVMGVRLAEGVMLAKARDTFMNMEEDPMNKMT